MPAFWQIKAYEPFFIPNVVYKVRPYLYCTKKQIEDPGGQVLIKADIWMATGEKLASTGLNKKEIKSEFMPRCEIDIDLKQIRRKNGDIVDAVNIDNVIDFIRRHVFSQDETD